MSFYNENTSEKSNNRIPSDSVIFSSKVFELEDFSGINKDGEKVDGLTENKVEELKAEIIELLRKEEKWLKEKELWEEKRIEELEKISAEKIKNERFYQELESRQKVITEKDVNLKNNIKKFELEKSVEMINIRSRAHFMAVELLNEMLNQTVNTKNLDFEKVILGMLTKMPNEFSNLKITTSPETKKCVEDDENQSWMFLGAEWKMDFRMKFGEFILEQDNEYKSFIYDEMIGEMKEIIVDSERGIEDEI